MVHSAPPIFGTLCRLMRCRLSGVGCRASDVVDVRPLQHTSVGLISLLYMQRTYTYVVGVRVHQILNFCNQGGLHVPRPTSTGVVDLGAAAVFVRCVRCRQV